MTQEVTTKHRGKRKTLTPYKIEQQERDLAILLDFKRMKAAKEYQVAEKLAEKYQYSHKVAIYRAKSRAEQRLLHPENPLI